MNRRQSVAILALAGLLTACGFQLRGVSNLPTSLTQLRLIDDGLNANQIRQLSDMLVKAGAKLQSSNVNDPVQLKVKISRLTERNLVDSAGTGKTIVQINIEQDSNNLLGTGSEKKAAERTLEQSLFSQLIFQLKRL
jgi:outer membrane lipopolysaccharide assembly protein LptE/RlpB